MDSIMIKRRVEIELIDFGKVTIESFDGDDGFVTMTFDNGVGDTPVSGDLSRQDVKTLADELLNWRFE
jgi:hypothetical protein